MGVVLYAGSQRFSTSDAGRVTRHSFSFGPHYDPANLGFGPLVSHNDDLLDPGAGYPDHPHSGLEIVTWVLDGALVHTASDGSRSVVSAGQAQVLSSGSGIVHSEVADAASGPCRFVQAWLRSDDPAGAPSYELGAAPGPADPGPTDPGQDGLVPVAGGDGLPIRTAGATLSVARLSPGQSVALPSSPLLHVFAATGSVELADGDGGRLPLGPGDAVRISDEPGQVVRAVEASELLVWSFRR